MTTTLLQDVDGGPLGGNAEGSGAPTINVKNIDGGPSWEAVPEVQERPPTT
jgi:hypothetical protein